MRNNLNRIFAIVLTLVVGCEIPPAHPDLAKQINDAISAINEFNRVVDRTPENLRVAAFKVADKLKIEGKDFLAHDVRNFTDITLGDAGAIMKGTLEFADAKMRAYFDALKAALITALPKVTAEKSRDKAIELLKGISVNIQPLDPFVDLAIPKPIEFTFKKSFDDKLTGVEYPSGRTIHLSGYGLLRPDGEPTLYRLEIFDKNGTKRLELNPTVSPGGPFVATVNMERFTPSEVDDEIRIYWGTTKLAQIGISKSIVKDAPPVKEEAVPQLPYLDTYELPELRGGQTTTPRICVGKLTAHIIDNKASLDASQTEAKLIEVTDKIDDGSDVKFFAPQGTVIIHGKIDGGGTKVQIIAPGGRVVIKGEINGGVTVTIVAKDIVFEKKLDNGRTNVDVTVSKGGSISYPELCAKLTYRKANADDPEPNLVGPPGTWDGKLQRAQP